MKKVKKIAAALTLASLLCVSTPMVAQTTDNTTTDVARADDDSDDGDTGKWGLAGLLGLLGLMGLRKKDNDDHRRTTTTVNR